MNFTEWESLSNEGRVAERSNWHVFEPGYWHTLATEAAARFAAEFGSSTKVERVCKSLYQAEDLIIAVQTATSKPVKKLPDSYLGFRVVQFNASPPEGVLVDVGPPSPAENN